MRDIRSDLRERRDSVRAKKAAMQAAVERMSAQEQILDKLIEEEDAMWEKISPPLFEKSESQGSALSQVLLETLKSKGGFAWLAELKESAVQRGVPFGEKQPGRVIHFAMLGMAQHNLVSRENNGRWRLVEEAVN
ncbi:MAG: hypothetical protein WBQ68_02800 [Terriglobales bacterium]